MLARFGGETRKKAMIKRLTGSYLHLASFSGPEERESIRIRIWFWIRIVSNGVAFDRIVFFFFYFKIARVAANWNSRAKNAVRKMAITISHF